MELPRPQKRLNLYPRLSKLELLLPWLVPLTSLRVSLLCHSTILNRRLERLTLLLLIFSTVANLNPANYPALDRIPPIDSPEVQQWIKEVDLSQAPNIPLTQLGACSNSSNSQAVTDASKNGWWTCGGHTRATDITFCPNKNDWGASFGKFNFLSLFSAL